MIDSKVYDDRFTFVNNTAFPVTKALLGNSWIGDPLTPVNVIPSDASNYEQLLQEKSLAPKRIFKMRFQSTTSQLNQSITWVTSDANGDKDSFTQLPSNFIDLYQFQDGLVDIEYKKGIIVGLNEYFIYTLLPFSQVSITFYYQDMRLQDLLRMTQKKIWEFFQPLKNIA